MTQSRDSLISLSDTLYITVYVGVFTLHSCAVKTNIQGKALSIRASG